MSYLLEFDLAEDLAFRGCALCRAAHRTGWRYLSRLLTEDVNNFRLREVLRKSGGFCREHLLLAVEVAARESDPLGIAIITGFLLEVAATNVGRTRRGQSIRRWPPRRRPPRLGVVLPEACPACAAEAVIVEGYASLLLTSSRDDIRHALSADDRGLCLPHLAVALRAAQGDRDVSRLVEAWARPARRFRRLLDEIIRKQSFQYRHEAAGEEAEAWRLAPEWLVGAARSRTGTIETGL